MFGLTEWKQTRFYQEVKTEGLQERIPIGRQQEKMETVPRLLKLGLSVEQVARALELNVEEVGGESYSQSLLKLDGKTAVDRCPSSASIAYLPPCNCCPT